MKQILKKLFKSKHKPEAPAAPETRPEREPRTPLTCPRCRSTSERFSVGLGPGGRYVRCKECDWGATFTSMHEFMQLLSGGNVLKMERGK